ncbi:MAG: ferritin, partial [Bacteroidales bacterium]|nr:ferritin [Bacteroidales bacterium]
LPKKVEDILNIQVDKEGYSSHLYLSMASWAENQGLGGIADWFYQQADEERLHMLKFIKYINERDGKAKMVAVKEPPAEFGSVKEVFEKVLEHEKFITASINEIVQICIDENDHTTNNWIQWFVKEQIEEEASVKGILDRLKLAGDHLYMFDRDILGMRSERGETAAE